MYGKAKQTAEQQAERSEANGVRIEVNYVR